MQFRADDDFSVAREPGRSGRARSISSLAGVFLWLAPVCLGAAWASPAAAESAALREYEIKAAFLFKFIEYIEWPSAAPSLDGPEISLCVLGDNPFGTALAPLEGKVVKGRTLLIEQVAALDDIGRCRVLFISPSESARLQQILDRLRGSTVLSVSELENSAARGVMINFVAERNKVRFEINPEAARRTGFTISSQLLKLATLVEPGT